jgi:hypothetical protein
MFVSSRPQVCCLRVRIPTIFPTRFPIPAQNPNFGWVHNLSLLCEQPALPVGLGAYHSLSLRTLITLYAQRLTARHRSHGHCGRWCITLGWILAWSA